MITKRTVESLPAKSMLWDDSVIGFGARRQTKGVFYLVRYRQNGRQRYLTIGRHGSPWTPDTARKKALELLGQVAGGTDPRNQMRPLSATLSFSDATDRYLATVKLRPAPMSETTRYLRRVAAPLHHADLTKIDRRKISTLLADVEKRSGGVTRNRLRSTLSALWNWCVREGLADSNPVTGTGRSPERTRERVLSEAELGAIWRNLGTGPFADAVRLLILTGQRRDEIGSLRWDEIQDDAIVLSADRTKNRRSHRIPLTPLMSAILERQPRHHDFVFGRAGWTSWDWHKTALEAKIKIPHFTLHDIRRSVATGMAELGVMPHVIEALLNHVSGHKAGISGIYNRAQYAREVEAASMRWSKYIEAL
jgi:integrase